MAVLKNETQTNDRVDSSSSELFIFLVRFFFLDRQNKFADFITLFSRDKSAETS